MRIKKIFLIILIICVIGIPILVVTLALESEPLIKQAKKLTIQDMERVERLLRANDPRKMQAEQINRLSLTERDVNLLLDYSRSRSPQTKNFYAHVELHSDLAQAQCTVILPKNPFGVYLNLSAMLSPSMQTITIEKLKVGALTIPRWLLKPFIQFAHRYLLGREEYRLVFEGTQVIKNIEIKENSIFITYQWQPELIKQLRSRGQELFLPAEEQQRLYAYNRKLSEISRLKRGRNVSLSKFIQPLFRLARERSASGKEPAAENRALIFTLAMYISGIKADKILSNEELKKYQPPIRITLTLLGRHDLAQHFLVSAAITVAASSDLANLVGLFKEMKDSRGGSGFSFADLAADQAGVKLGEAAVGSSYQAVLLQQRLSKRINETDFMPQVDQLPEGIMELEFKQKYKDVDSATFRMVEMEIERRISACWIYQ